MSRGEKTMLQDMALSMKTKYDKYLRDLSKINIFLYMAIVIDSST